MYVALNFHTVCKGYLSLYYIPVITPQNIACADSQSIGCLFFTVFVYVLYVLISRIYRASGDFSGSLYFAQVINCSVIIDNSVVDDCSVVNYCSVYIYCSVICQGYALVYYQFLSCFYCQSMSLRNFKVRCRCYSISVKLSFASLEDNTFPAVLVALVAY